MVQFLKHIVCPSCRATDRYQVSLDSFHNRVILYCSGCEFRLSLPMDKSRFEKPEYMSMPLEFDETSKVKP